MATWYLNRFLDSFRDEVNEEFPDRGKRSDGTIGDRKHRAKVSQHNPDWDGSVDAWDLDVNLFGSSYETGTPDERDAMYQLIERFKQQPQAQLVIFRGRIANRDVSNWRWRAYDGGNPHDKHAHLQSKSSRERESFRGDLDGIVDAINAQVVKVKPGGKAPRWPHAADEFYRPYLDRSAARRFGQRVFSVKTPQFRSGVKAAQDQLDRRGWPVDADGFFGEQTLAVVRAFQEEKGLTVDGLIGPATWRAIWEAPIT